jgi:hypothetical protein
LAFQALSGQNCGPCDLIGVILILAAIIVFLVALIKTALGPSKA